MPDTTHDPDASCIGKRDRASSEGCPAGDASAGLANDPQWGGGQPKDSHREAKSWTPKAAEPLEAQPLLRGIRRQEAARQRLADLLAGLRSAHARGVIHPGMDPLMAAELGRIEQLQAGIDSALGCLEARLETLEQAHAARSAARSAANQASRDPVAIIDAMADALDTVADPALDGITEQELRRYGFSALDIDMHADAARSLTRTRRIATAMEDAGTGAEHPGAP